MSVAMPRIFKVFLTSLLLLGTNSTGASAQLTPGRAYHPPLYTVQVEDQWGNRLRTFRQRGRVYLLGNYGNAYQVHIENKSGQRVEAVISVDGRDAVSGNVADYTTQRGYIIAPYDSVTISGFRESFDNVRQFRFTDPGNSYSSLRGTPQYLGVIGVAFFPERSYQRPRVQAIPRPSPSPRGNRASGAPAPQKSVGQYESNDAPSAAAPRAKAEESRGSAAGSGDSASASSHYDDEAQRREGTGNLGTEYGERSYSPVQEVNFSRQDQTHPRGLVRLYYDDESGLIARGIEVNPPPPTYPQPYAYSEPDPFPATRFAPPP